MTGFTNPFGAPPDPAYVRFVEGFDKYRFSDAFDLFPQRGAAHQWVRWHPKSANWYDYAPPRFELVDRLLPKTDVGLRNLEGFPSLYGPAAFRAVSAFYETIRQEHEHAVWNPRDGSWRDARSTDRRPPPQPAPPPPPPPLDAARLRARADRQREMDFAYQQYAERRIDTEHYKRELDRIEAKYRDLI